MQPLVRGDRGIVGLDVVAVLVLLRTETRETDALDGGADVRTSMLLKDLCSHEWVKETYGDKLPDVPWIGHPRLPLQQRPTGT